MRQRIIIVRATGIGQNVPRRDDMDDGSWDGNDSMNGAAKPHFTNTQPCSFRDGLTTSLNGATHPVITIAPGERQFFSVVNATGHKTLRFKVEEKRSKSSRLTASRSTPSGNAADAHESAVIIPPAGRAEFVVTGPASGRPSSIRSATTPGRTATAIRTSGSPSSWPEASRSRGRFLVAR